MKIKSETSKQKLRIQEFIDENYKLNYTTTKEEEKGKWRRVYEGEGSEDPLSMECANSQNFKLVSSVPQSNP